jgi:hypothetical protein
MGIPTKRAFPRLRQDFNLMAMSRQQLTALAERIDRELDTRAFEENLKRELEAHMRRQQWSDRTASNRRL